jgi:hypothetical protein
MLKGIEDDCRPVPEGSSPPGEDRSGIRKTSSSPPCEGEEKKMFEC